MLLQGQFELRHVLLLQGTQVADIGDVVIAGRRQPLAQRQIIVAR